MSQIKLNIITKTQKYPIFIGKELCTKISQITKSNSIKFNKCLLVVDSNVPKKFVFITPSISFFETSTAASAQQSIIKSYLGNFCILLKL